MARKDKRINITWSDNMERYAERVVAKYAGEMGVAGIPTRTSTRASGEETINRSGAIEFALKKLAEGETKQ